MLCPPKGFPWVPRELISIFKKFANCNQDQRCNDKQYEGESANFVDPLWID